MPGTPKWVMRAADNLGVEVVPRLSSDALNGGMGRDSVRSAPILAAAAACGTGEAPVSCQTAAAVAGRAPLRVMRAVRFWSVLLMTTSVIASFRVGSAAAA